MFPINSTDRLIFVNINNSYEAFIYNRRTSSYFRESLYDCTVKYWRISEKKAAMATHIIGCYKGKSLRWLKSIALILSSLKNTLEEKFLRV